MGWSDDPVTNGSWLALPDVLAACKLPTDLAVDDDRHARVERARLAAAAQVERHRRDLQARDVDGTVTGFTAAGDVLAGALLLAARLYARQDSPTGLASYGEFGPAPVARFDADVERLLGIGRYAPPAVG